MCYTEDIPHIDVIYNVYISFVAVTQAVISGKCMVWTVVQEADASLIPSRIGGWGGGDHECGELLVKVMSYLVELGIFSWDYFVCLYVYQGVCVNQGYYYYCILQYVSHELFLYLWLQCVTLTKICHWSKGPAHWKIYWSCWASVRHNGSDQKRSLYRAEAYICCWLCLKFRVKLSVISKVLHT